MSLCWPSSSRLNCRPCLILMLIFFFSFHHYYNTIIIIMQLDHSIMILAALCCATIDIRFFFLLLLLLLCFWSCNSVRGVQCIIIIMYRSCKKPIFSRILLLHKRQRVNINVYMYNSVMMMINVRQVDRLHRIIK